MIEFIDEGISGHIKHTGFYRWRYIRTSLAWWSELTKLPTPAHRTWPLRTLFLPTFGFGLFGKWSGIWAGLVGFSRKWVLPKWVEVRGCLLVRCSEEGGGQGCCLRSREVVVVRGEQGSQVWSWLPQANIPHCSLWHLLFCFSLAFGFIVWNGHLHMAEIPLLKEHHSVPLSYLHVFC